MACTATSMGQKLAPIADAVAGMLRSEFGLTASYELECEFTWLSTCPSPETFSNVWPTLSSIYSVIVDNEFSFDDRVSLSRERGDAKQQKIDIWFAAPYSFALEYDERQHFSQFREGGLRCYSGAGYKALPFDLEGYLKACGPARPGTSGWQRLRTPDPLFPPMLPGEAQDNRHRQRAFRDSLKDLAPFCVQGVNGTRRIGAYVLGWKRTGFTKADCRLVCEHLLAFGRLDDLRLF